MEELLTIKQAAPLLGISVDTLREKVWGGEIDYINLNPYGKQIHARFTQKHLKDFLKKCEVKAG